MFPWNKSLCSPKSKSLFSMFLVPQNNLCNPVPLIFRHLFPWNKYPYFSVPQKAWEGFNFSHSKNGQEWGWRYPEGMKDRDRCKNIVATSSVVLQWPLKLKDWDEIRCHYNTNWTSMLHGEKGVYYYRNDPKFSDRQVQANSVDCS